MGSRPSCRPSTARSRRPAVPPARLPRRPPRARQPGRYRGEQGCARSRAWWSCSIGCRLSGRMDVIADLAYPLPVTVICDMLGVPVGDHEQIKESSDIIPVQLRSASRPTCRARTHRPTRHRGLLPRAASRAPPPSARGPAIRSSRSRSRATGSPRASCSPPASCSSSPATRPPWNLIGNGLLSLLRHPVEVERLRREPGLIGSAVEELLRYAHPVQRTARSNAEVEVGGKTIPKAPSWSPRLLRRGQPDPRALSGPRPARRRPRRQPPHRVRLRHPLAGRSAGPAWRHSSRSARRRGASGLRLAGGAARVAGVVDAAGPQGPPVEAVQPPPSPPGGRERGGMAPERGATSARRRLRHLPVLRSGAALIRPRNRPRRRRP